VQHGSTSEMMFVEPHDYMTRQLLYQRIFGIQFFCGSYFIDTVLCLLRNLFRPVSKIVARIHPFVRYSNW
jgi:hypothetical protein